MDDETRKLLTLILAAVRQIAETSRNNAEMNWQLWDALSERNPDFAAAFQARKHVSFEHLHGLTESLIQRLDEALRKLEQ